MNLLGVVIASSLTLLAWAGSPREDARAIEALIDADELDGARERLGEVDLPPFGLAVLIPATSPCAG